MRRIAGRSWTENGRNEGRRLKTENLPSRFDSLDPVRGGRSFRFSGEAGGIEAWAPDEVLPALREVEASAAAGLHAAGFVTYEAAPAMDPALAVHAPPPGLPLLRFTLFSRRERIEPLAGLPGAGDFSLSALEPSLGRAGYEKKVHRIQGLIAAGDTYQVNLTFPLRGRFEGSTLALYGELCRAQRAAYCAHLVAGAHVIVSASPELFFRLSGDEIELRPMKGTRPRGRWPEEDERLARELGTAEKDRAENLMIVDLLRNDLGRVAEFGSVRVPRLFELERYPTVHQMTSTVTGRRRAGVGLADLFAALFPSGSVTGAPKIRTSEIIRELEPAARGPYTGAIGFVSPDESVFSVAIRTLVVDTRDGTATLGVGSGITSGSDGAEEYAECLGKGEFARRPRPAFDLLESLRLEPDGTYPLLDGHLERMAAAAAYFVCPFAATAARAALAAAADGADGRVCKVRLLMDAAGRFRTDREEIPAVSPAVRLAFAREPVDERDPFLYHKTTRRETYARALASVPGADDAILFNQRGEVTETTTANLVLDLDGERVTPPLASGLLPGVLRARLLAEGAIRERTVGRADVDRAVAIHLINAVRGWRAGVLAGRDAPAGDGIRREDRLRLG